MYNPMDLTGKFILVTGASSGIGRETAIYISRLGARVALVARREDELAKTLGTLEGNGHRYYPFDLTHIDDIEALVKLMRTENGLFDGMVYSAGVGTTRPLQMFKYENVHQVMLINFYPFVELARVLSKRGNFNQGMSVVGISSMASVGGASALTAYAASKAAMDAAMRCMALELAPKGIRVNTILPAWIATDMYREYQDNSGRDDNSFKTNENMGVGKPQDIAAMAAYLLSDTAKFVTRSGFQITGGAV